MHYPGGESALAWLSRDTVLVLQLVAHVFVTAGIWWVCRRLEGRFAAGFAVVWWLVWPSAWDAVRWPYYYYWPIPFTVGLAALWVRGKTRWTTPLIVAWAQFRMTAVGPMVATRHWAALALTAVLVAGGHGRTQIWHDLYIGIGVWPNPYGVVYSDEHAIAFAAARGVAFKSPEYEPLLRAEYLRIAAADPLLIARNACINFVCAIGGWSFWGGMWLTWVAIVVLWAARKPGVHRDLTVVWLSQCATLAVVTKPQEGYLWETAGLFVVLGSVGLSRLVQDAARALEPGFN